jgi:hypothetical protein
MKAKLLLTLAVVSFIALAFMPFITDGAVSSTSNYYVTGYVADSDRNPMEGVTVSISNPDGQGPPFTGNTDTDGFFNIVIPSDKTLVSYTGLTISFNVYGYTAINCPNTTLPNKDSDYFILNLSKATYSNVTKTYTLTGSVTDMNCVIMKATTGTVIGQVQVLGESRQIKNATVMLTTVADEGTDKAIYSSNTDEHGYYSIICPTGTYVVTSTCQGFIETNAGTVTVTDSDNPSTKNIAMEKSELTMHFGLDTAHLLMLIGVIVGILVAIAAWFLSRRMNRSHGLEIFDDSEEEDDDLRYS